MSRISGVVGLVTTTAVVMSLSSCSSDGVGTVADDDGFRACVEKAGASLTGSDDWDEKQQLAFWREPGTLDCALDELDDEQRENALAGAFTQLDKSDQGDDTARRAQQGVLGDWAAHAGEARERDDAVDRAGELLSTLWVADEDEPYAAHGMEMVMAFSLYVAYYGEPTGFEEYVADDAGNVTDPSDQQTYFIDRMSENSAHGPQAKEWTRMKGLIDGIDEAFDQAKDDS